ncbi:Versatile liquid phase peroxidase 2 [Hyphodiscus hymeniophilus]|uniref:Peroxidase n=1 Tax=Hyphodiscus hymeniophilus TaxID=353542 RepID=A0A9P6VIX3_9HELO|nr:Versatile liquid phase peroxidase 2 [Hyphodiscus hymeniophilus]
MKFAYFITSAGAALAYPGISNLIAELAKRQGAPTPPPVMIGDLAQRATTPVGNQVKNCLLGTGPCQNLTPKARVSMNYSSDKHSHHLQTYVTPPLGSLGCLQDTCCVWNYVQADLVKMFTNADGSCNAAARTAVRLGFHDAGAWSTSSGAGGADGSLVLSPDEINRSENNGLQNIRDQALALIAKYAVWGVGQLIWHNSCTMLQPSLTSDPTGLLPNTNSPAEQLIELFGNKTINFKDLIALIGAHTTAQQFFVDTTKAGQPLDSTPGVWDVAFYSEVLTPTPPSGVFRLPSDQALASDPETNPGFGVFSDPTSGQANWNAAYATAYVRLSLLGVNNINKLTDCTKVLPNPITTFPK